jgi:hypothetical protein
MRLFWWDGLHFFQIAMFKLILHPGKIELWYQRRIPLPLDGVFPLLLLYLVYG